MDFLFILFRSSSKDQHFYSRNNLSFLLKSFLIIFFFEKLSEHSEISHINHINNFQSVFHFFRTKTEARNLSCQKNIKFFLGVRVKNFFDRFLSFFRWLLSFRFFVFDRKDKPSAFSFANLTAIRVFSTRFPLVSIRFCRVIDFEWTQSVFKQI